MAPSRAPIKSSSPWTPDIHDRALQHLEQNDNLLAAITTAFLLPERDTYVYHAIVSVTLAQVQQVVQLGGANGLHAWYRCQPEKENLGGEILPPPPRTDIEAYLNIFAPSTNTANTLKNLGTNAKKGSLRSSIAAYLQQKYFLHSDLLSLQIPPTKKKTASRPPSNPYLDFLNWACKALEWAGPCPESAGTMTAHHVLPILMHHFGCVCPSHEALSILKVVADGRPILDVGSGNGYWTWMLRQYGVSTIAIDNAQSSWRTTWISDTEIVDGPTYLRKHSGGRGTVLMLVYPIVGGAIAGGEEGGFTRSLVKAYDGDTIAVVGTQNHNGYTGFRDMAMDEYMAREQPQWTKVVQIPLPSFPGKDEALFVFQRLDRPPKVAQAKTNT